MNPINIRSQALLKDIITTSSSANARRIEEKKGRL
jgi:hypothetical protein